MKVGSLEWEKRYDGLAETLGLDLSKFGVGVDPVFETFCLAELELFDEAISPLRKDDSLLNNFMEELRGSIADPFYAYLCFQSVVFPSLRKRHTYYKELLETYDQKLKEMAIQKGLSLGVLNSDEPERFKEKFKGKFRLMLKGIDSILEEEKRLSDYLRFNTSLVKVTNRNYENRLILVPPRVVMANLGLRNELYREVLNPNQKDLLWYAPTLILHTRRQNALENSIKLSDFKRIVSEHPEFSHFLDEHEITFSFTSSPEERKASVREVYEEILPGILIPLPKLNELEAVITNHFHQRFGFIFSS